MVKNINKMGVLIGITGITTIFAYGSYRLGQEADEAEDKNETLKITTTTLNETSRSLADMNNDLDSMIQSATKMNEQLEEIESALQDYRQIEEENTRDYGIKTEEDGTITIYDKPNNTPPSQTINEMLDFMQEYQQEKKSGGIENFDVATIYDVTTLGGGDVEPAKLVREQVPVTPRDYGVKIEEDGTITIYDKSK